MKPMMTTEVRVRDEDTGIIHTKEIVNIEDDKFTVDQVYMIPVNDKGDESVTCLRLVIPAGTHYRDGYAEVRKVLQHVVDSDDIDELVRVLEIPEVMA
jgi:hypothetical protein